MTLPHRGTLDGTEAHEPSGGGPPGRVAALGDPMKRPCLDCGVLSDGTRCPTHTRQRNASPERKALYGGHWQRYSRAKRKAHPWCSSCGSTSDLTVDHPSDAVLCRPCHGKLEASRRAAR